MDHIAILPEPFSNIKGADPFAGRISNESLVGQNLLGKRVGDVVEIIVPDGTLNLKVKSISK